MKKLTGQQLNNDITNHGLHDLFIWLLTFSYSKLPEILKEAFRQSRGSGSPRTPFSFFIAAGRCALLPLFILCFILASSYSLRAQSSSRVSIVLEKNASLRAKFGAEKLAATLKTAGYVTVISDKIPATSPAIVITELGTPLYTSTLSRWQLRSGKKPGKEGFEILSAKNGNVIISGADASGSLYGCVELCDQIKKTGRLPKQVALTDQPEMVLRGTCIGVQKPYYLPGRTVYEYPYTPQTFPWLYDKKLWIQYLDSLVDHRMNSLFLWNGHPFASLVRLKDYPYAVEVDDSTFRKNEEMYSFLTHEADKRGIWVIQMFYNIIVSKPFAEHNHIKTQDRERPIIPLIADYTRKSIAAFVEKYPNVGLMVCLGEAMEGTGNDDIEWFTKTIIPGVQDGLKALGKTAEPPIVLRAHDTDAPSVMEAALPLYKNLYTEAKFNGEALTTPEPRGTWADLHRTLSRLGSVQIENVHILANLEPFRYGATDFIQKSVKGMHRIMEGNGLHLYPQASYWDWPYSADSVNGKRLLQIERDWIWYAAWSRYAWNANRDSIDEDKYWSAQLATHYGCTPEQGRKILEAYQESGEIAPKLLRRFGITDGNRQTLTLGMLMTQLINPYRYGLFTLLYDSESPEGEMLGDYAEKEWNRRPHIGETPVQIIREVRQHGDKAVAAAQSVEKYITRNKEEFKRLTNDMYCYQALADHYASKAEAALKILRYKFSNDISDLDAALPLLQKSVDEYKQLAALTKGTYLYANSMQTQQRKIPMRGVNGTFKTWTEMVPPFEKELAHFRHAIDSLKKEPPKKPRSIQLLQPATVQLGDATLQRFSLDSLARVYSDTAVLVSSLAPELKGLQGVQASVQHQMQSGTQLKFTCSQPVSVLIGYYNGRPPAFSKNISYAKAPELETNASANEYGQAETKIANALVIRGWPPVNIHSYSFPAGTHELRLPRGACLLLGFVKGEQDIPQYDAGLLESGSKKEIDWLFE